MRAAYLLSLMCVICGVGAVMGYSVVYLAGRPITGVSGLLLSLVYACLPPLVVLGVRRFRRK